MIMNAVPYYYYELHQGTGMAVRALLNDLPFHRGSGAESVSIASPANHLLLPGVNVLRLEITRASGPPCAPMTEGPVRFSLRIDDGEDTVVHTVVWPNSAKASSPLPSAQTFVHESRFEVDARISRPVYWDAPRGRFGSKGTPEQREVVRELCRALTKGDAKGFIRINMLKLQERQRAYPGIPEQTINHQREKIIAHFPGRWSLRDIDLRDFKDMTFESLAEGRIAYVKRSTGEHAIEAVSVSSPKQIFFSDVFLTKYNGSWRIFR